MARMWDFLVVVAIIIMREAKLGVSLEDYKDAVFVSLTEDTINGSGVVKFDHEELDVRGSYDRKAAQFYAEKAGIYWVALSAGANPQTTAFKVGYRLQRGGSEYCYLRRDYSNLNGNETLSRDIMVPMNSLQTLHMTKDKMLYSSDGYETSFSVFRLTGLMNTSAFFSVWRRYSIRLTAGQVVPYTTVLVNEGNVFNTTTSLFTAPQEGVYFFSFSIGTFYGAHSYDMSLRRRFSVLSGIEDYCTSAIRNDFDTVSRSGLYYLLKGDIVSVQSDKTTNYLLGHSNANAFSGFLYDPIHGQKKAWSVARKKSWQGSTALDPVPFDDVIVNLGNTWSTWGNFYRVPMDGVYYLTVTVGALPGIPVDVKVYVSGQRRIAVTSSSTNRDGIQLLSRSAILYLKGGSKVKLRAEENTGMYSTLERQTSFTGLLLFPISAPGKGAKLDK